MKEELASFESKHRLHCRDNATRAQREDREERPLGPLHPPLEGPSVGHRARVQQARADEKGGDAGERRAGEEPGGLDQAELDEHEGRVPVFFVVVLLFIERGGKRGRASGEREVR